jgi:DNA-binding response OmpR family regulator/DNA-binding CsgD family transcriptional regulator
MNQTSRILIVESRHDLSQGLTHLLQQANYQTQVAKSNPVALQTLQTFWPDLILANVRTPDVDGLALARRVKEISDVPIIFLTALADHNLVVASLRQYAEDYIALPFRPDELTARIERVLYRTGPGLPQALVTVNDVTLDFCQGQIHTPSHVYSLSAVEARLLYHLVRYAGQAVPAGMLLRMAWPQTSPTEDQLRQAIRRLTREMGNYISGEPNVGYRFTPLGRPDSPRLTRRQREILALIAQGLTNNEIAMTLRISTKTVEFHYKQIRLSLQATSRPHAVAVAFTCGLLSRATALQPLPAA